MTSEEVLLKDQLEEGSDIKPKITAKFLWIQGIVFAAGLSLLIYVLYKIGFGVIAETIGTVFWGFLIIVATNFSRHLIRATCIYLAIPK